MDSLFFSTTHNYDFLFSLGPEWGFHELSRLDKQKDREERQVRDQHPEEEPQSQHLRVLVEVTS